jgi:signal transduction histidine kinase
VKSLFFQDAGKMSMDKTIIEIPTELLLAAKVTPEEARTQLAIRLYQLHKLNDEQASALAGDPKAIETLAWNHQETGQVNLDDFLSWASHDLKSPLNAIIGFTKVVIKGMDGPINEMQKTDLTTAFNGSQRMLSLINNLVEMAHLNNGDVILLRKECNVADLIKDVTDQWQIKNPELPLTTNVNIMMPNFNIDESRLRQIISNLLTYASIRVTKGAISLSASDDDHGLNISIQSVGEKARDKSEMDSAMFNFICTSLIKLHGGKANEPHETEDGFLLAFSLPR